MKNSNLSVKTHVRIPRKFSIDTISDEFYYEVGRTQQHIMQSHLDILKKEGKLVGDEGFKMDSFINLLAHRVFTIKSENIDQNKKLAIRREIQGIVMELNEEIIRLNELFVSITSLRHDKAAGNDKQGIWR